MPGTYYAMGDKQMKILELGKFYHPYRGGIETLLRIYCEGFVQKGASVDCVVANSGYRTNHEQINGVAVHRCASLGTLLSTSMSLAYLRQVLKLRPNLIHSHFPNPLADLACLLCPKNIPMVVTYHSDIIRQSGLLKFYAPIIHSVLQRADQIIVATEGHLKFSPWLNKYADKCQIIPFGIDLNPFQTVNSAKVGQLRKSAGNRPILLNIGRLVGYKGQRYLIEAAQNLDVMVWIVGSGPLEAELTAMAESLGVASRVRFWGSMDEESMLNLLHACDVFVLPSISPNEAFGLVQIEAMACGKPVISTLLPSGVPYVNVDGKTGLLVQPSDARALAAAIQQMIAKPDWMTELGEKGKVRARQMYAAPVMVDNYWNSMVKLMKYQL